MGALELKSYMFFGYISFLNQEGWKSQIDRQYRLLARQLKRQINRQINRYIDRQIDNMHQKKYIIEVGELLGPSTK